MLHSLIYVHGKQEERADCSVERWAKSETTAFLNSFPKTIRTCKKVPSGQVTFHSYLRHEKGSSKSFDTSWGKLECKIFSCRGKSTPIPKETFTRFKISEAIYYVQNLHDKELT